MTSENHDPSNVTLVVGTRIIVDAGGISGLSPDRSPSPIMKPGRVRVGVNRQQGANGADFSFKVLESSKDDLQYLYGLVDTQVEIPVVARVVRNLASYATGQQIGLGCQFGVLGGGSVGMGDSEEAGFIEFSVTGRGQIREYAP